MRCLVTAGNTREKIDRVRDWGNIFTGRTGLAIARALTTIGAVDLLTSNQQHLDELEKEVDRLCLEFLVRQQPAGGHLRFAYATIKMQSWDP